MNIIRTQAVELSVIPALAYKQKLSTGGAGIKILRVEGISAVCTINKRTTEMTPYGKVEEDLFPMEAFDEAYELTNSLPYSARGNIKLSAIEVAQSEDVTEDAPAEQVDMTLSPEYKAIVERYSDEKGKINYTLMNKDFIQFASKSKIVANMVEAGAGQDEIVETVVKSRATEISRQKESLDDESVKLLIETLDEIDPRSAFKELKNHINRMLAKQRGSRK
ncbi:MAG: hypothetical protein FWG48_06025 [Oscillospiraceae bacterium]|nr:hypothetical protein [Oscillospiraceae bacterium]